MQTGQLALSKTAMHRAEFELREELDIKDAEVLLTKMRAKL
jgi:hypothetical protein